MLMLDVTTKCEKTMMFYPQMMNFQINNFVRFSKDFETLLPLSCATYKIAMFLALYNKHLGLPIYGRKMTKVVFAIE